MLASCGTNPKPIEIRTIPVERSIPKQQAPRPLNIASPKFIVITAANFEQYRDRLLNGNLVIYGLTEADYKLLLKNQSEYRRYIEQQKAVVVFYEDNI